MFNVQKIYFCLLSVYLYFVCISEKNSDYSPIQNILFFIIEKECLYWVVLAESLYIIQRILVCRKVVPWFRRWSLSLVL